MKRLIIWISHFSLVQQFLSLILVTGTLMILFVFSFVTNNIDSFINNQMHTYIHRAQSAFLDNRITYSETNVVHFIYSVERGTYLNLDNEEYAEIIMRINPALVLDSYDGSFVYGNDSVVYSVKTYDENFRLVSIIKNTFRDEFKSALFTGVIDVVLYVVVGIAALVLFWVLSLMHPLNLITTYINKIKEGEKTKLNVVRHDEIGEVAEALTNMHEELTQQQHIRDEMVQNISHDLKTPIATIKSYSESIKDGVYPYDTLEKSVDVIIENADRLEKKVYSLITFNKLGYLTNTQDNILNLNMYQTIQKAILACQVLRNDITIKTDLDKDVCFHGEEEPWRVVVENLVDNALRYAKKVVKINLKDNLLEVYNDGELMDEDRIAKLFKPYEKGTKGKFGLGLSIVKRVTETYGYVVTGENMNDGVIFRIYTNKKMKKLPKKKNKKDDKENGLS